jgi:hypothetical protein
MNRTASQATPHPFAWDALVPLLVHPMRVAVIEALVQIGQPLSARDLEKVFDEKFDLSLISYHVVQLAKVEAIVKVRERQVRGSLEKFYFFP